MSSTGSHARRGSLAGAAHRRLTCWRALVCALGAAPVLAGCPGDLSPQLQAAATGGGGTPGGGAAGAGGSADCSSAGAQIITTLCAQVSCHDPTGAATFSGGLDLTLDSGIASRLVGVVSSGSLATNGSVCAGTTTEPYLVPHMAPATGLLIDKTMANHVCGNRMPYLAGILTDAQTQCLIDWATTLTSP